MLARFVMAAALLGALPARAQTPTKIGLSTFVEVSPLRGAVGQPAARLELVPWRNVGVDVGYEAWSSAGERGAAGDRHTAAAVDVVVYPFGLATYPVFFAGGMRAEQADLGRQRPRDAVTWARTDARDATDVWINHDTYTSVTETIGYRLLTARLFTMSLRFVRDEVVATASTADAAGVVSRGVDLRTPGRQPVEERLELYAGLWLH